MQVKVSGSNNYLEKNNIVCFFEPQSVAVVGTLRESYFGSHAIIKNLLEVGFMGKIYPIDVSCSEFMGLKVHASLKNISEKIDLVLAIVNSSMISNLMIECVEKDVKAIIIFSNSFLESDEGKFILQKEVLEIAKRSGIRVIGPNTAGIINTGNSFISHPYIMGHGKIKLGGISLCGQNRMISPHTYPFADFHYGISKVCDLGNKSDVDESDILEYLENDSSTKVIAMHIENIRDGKRFLKIARRVTYKKPVLVLKPGRTNEQVFDAACKQAGIILLEKFSELFEIPKFFAFQPLPKGNQFGIISYTGMGAALAADEGAKYNLSIAKLSPDTIAKLNVISPGLCKSVVDLGPLMALKNDYISVYPEILKVVLEDDNIDCLFHILWAAPMGPFLEDYIKIFRNLRSVSQKPVVIWVYGPRQPNVYDLTCNLEDLGFPVFSALETAIKAIGLAYQYAIWKGRKP
ncbi:MAG: CoA-binding protein [Syntrophaceae bacterium]|nr:CoA-binding protein [Syntrophaceae bacterium]